VREPLVTVVMPCYDAARWLEETLASVFAQTHSNLQIIAVDDGSKDATWEILERCADSRLQRYRQPNAGAAAARNFALARACGDFVQFLDADDLIDCDKIRIQVEAAAKHAGKWVLASAWGRFHGSIGETRWEPPWNPLEWRGIDWLVHAWTDGAMMPPHGWLVPRAIVDSAGPWNPAAGINDDGEYFARVLLAADGVAQVAGARAHYRSGNASYSQRTDRWAWESLLDSYELCARHMLAAEDSARVRAAIGARLRSFQYLAYPAFADLSARAQELADPLAIGGGPPHGGGIASRIACRAIGWKLTRRIGLLVRSGGRGACPP
jgi:glycosyltransferase involved in cell wall biosynthesis